MAAGVFAHPHRGQGVGAQAEEVQALLQCPRRHPVKGIVIAAAIAVIVGGRSGGGRNGGNGGGGGGGGRERVLAGGQEQGAELGRREDSEER